MGSSAERVLFRGSAGCCHAGRFFFYFRHHVVNVLEMATVTATVLHGSSAESREFVGEAERDPKCCCQRSSSI